MMVDRKENENKCPICDHLFYWHLSYRSDNLYPLRTCSYYFKLNDICNCSYHLDCISEEMVDT